MSAPPSDTAKALDAAIASINFRHDDESGLAKFNLLAFSLLHQHGPALAAALKVLDAAIAWRQCSDGYHNRNTDKLVDAIDAAISARVDDTPTRGTP